MWAILVDLCHIVLAGGWSPWRLGVALFSGFSFEPVREFDPLPPLLPPMRRAVIALTILAVAAAQNSNANDRAFNDKFNGWAAGNGKQYLTAEE